MGKIYIKDNEILKKFSHNALNNEIIVDSLTIGSEKVIWWQCDKSHSWKQAIAAFAKNPICQYCNNMKVWPGFNDLESMFPEFARQWNYKKNISTLNPSNVLYKSSKKVWWQCDKGHEWESVINDRTRADKKGSINCPYCSGKKVLQGFNDLATLNTSIASQWSSTNDTNPDAFTAGSNKKVWWQCDKGHEWEAVIYERARSDGKSTGCPFCSNRKVIIGFNDLKTINPETASQWHPTRNGTLKPSNVIAGSNKKVWWQCDKGHEWEAVIHERSKGSGCPFCANQKVIVGFNDLKTINPETASQWHPTRNGTLKPSDITSGSNKKVWWQCDKGHEWEATCGDRKYGYGCLKCSNVYSKKEKEIQDFISSLGFKTETNTRSIIKGELDIYIPEKQIAIEYNGLYWHSEESGKDKHYHYDKWLACKNKGIQLIQIWEDDYTRNPELVKNMIAHKLDASHQTTVYARKTIVKTLTKTQADDFLNNNHIQGSVDGKIRLGLLTEGIIVAVMVLKTEAGSNGKILNLLRYATISKVVGGFTKLLSWVEKNHPNIESIVTFSDNTVSNGGLYENNGFKDIKKIEPDYMYIVNKNRNHKFNYRLNRFKTDSNLIWKEGLTEAQLAKINNLPRIWDAGKTKWQKDLNTIHLKENEV